MSIILFALLSVEHVARRPGCLKSSLCSEEYPSHVPKTSSVTSFIIRPVLISIYSSLDPCGGVSPSPSELGFKILGQLIQTEQNSISCNYRIMNKTMIACKIPEFFTGKPVHYNQLTACSEIVIGEFGIFNPDGIILHSREIQQNYFQGLRRSSYTPIYPKLFSVHHPRLKCFHQISVFLYPPGCISLLRLYKHIPLLQ